MTPNTSSAPAGDVFVTTHWTVVLQAGQRSTPDSERALEELCRTYWYPLYAYVRRKGYGREDAEDLTQAFFAAFLKKNYLERLSAERGHFRAFLLACLKHFLANEWDKSQRQKRGGSLDHLSLDWQSADAQFQVADQSEPSPDKAFDREWALALLSKVIDRLRAECSAGGRGEEFDQLKSFLTTGKSDLSHAEAARLLGTNEGAARVAVHRLRKRYRQLLRDEISQTLTASAPVIWRSMKRSMPGTKKSSPPSPLWLRAPSSAWTAWIPPLLAWTSARRFFDPFFTHPCYGSDPAQQFTARRLKPGSRTRSSKPGTSTRQPNRQAPPPRFRWTQILRGPGKN